MLNATSQSVLEPWKLLALALPLLPRLLPPPSLTLPPPYPDLAASHRRLSKELLLLHGAALLEVEDSTSRHSTKQDSKSQPSTANHISYAPEVFQNILWALPDTFLAPSDIFLIPYDTCLTPPNTFPTPFYTFLTPFDNFLTPSDTI